MGLAGIFTDSRGSRSGAQRLTRHLTQPNPGDAVSQPDAPQQGTGQRPSPDLDKPRTRAEDDGLQKESTLSL